MSVWVIAGADRGRTKEQVDRILEQTARQKGCNPEKLLIYAGEDNVEEALVRLRNLGLFSDHTVAVIHQAELLGVQEVKAVKAWVQRPPENATLVFLSDETKTGTDKLSFVPKDHIKIIYEMSEGEKKGAIVSTLERRGYQIDHEALELLADLVSADSADIQSQCAMLATMAKDRRTIDADIVETWVYHSREETVYTLFEVLMTKDLAAVLESLRKIIQSQESEPIGVVLGLQWQYRSLLGLMEEGIRRPGPDDFRARRIFFKRSQQTYATALQRFDKAKIRHAVHSLARYDRNLREARAGSHGLILEMLMYELCTFRSLGLGEQPASFWG